MSDRAEATYSGGSKGIKWWHWLLISLGLIAAFWIGFWTNAPKGAPYSTSVQREVLIAGADIDQSLLIAERELAQTGFDSVLAIWGIRDQIFSEQQARRVSELYFEYIESKQDYFELWHLTWAVSNIYRNGRQAVRTQLELAYQDATKQAKEAGGWADDHVNGPIAMGDIHLPARLYVREHVVAPGNHAYLQSIDDYEP